VTVSFIGRGNRSTRRKPPTCRESLTFELTTLVVIGTHSKSKYHTITTTAAPALNEILN